MSSIPYHLDALLPTPERYASSKFRRFAQYFQWKTLDWYDALELVAFVESIGGVKFARYILQWRSPAVVRAYRKLRKHVGADAENAIRANVEAFGPHVGLAVLAAMQDGGWKRGKVPPVVQMSIKAMRKAGNKVPQIADATGLTVAQVQYLLTGRSQRGKHARNRAYGALAL